MSATRHVCPLCDRPISATHFKRHLAAHDRYGAGRAVTNAAWLAFLHVAEGWAVSRATRRPPVAMFRGCVPRWHLYDGSPGERLVSFDGEHDIARRMAEDWCERHGFYLSPWSDADDRVPDSECTCDPTMGDAFTAGCPMHRPRPEHVTPEEEEE